MKHFCSLSEAIREGAKLRPQATALFERLPTGVIASCAIGAAYEAMTAEAVLSSNDSRVYGTVAASFPYMCLQMVRCPDGCNSDAWLESMIMHLNDDHGWTRERIADFVEKFEESIGFVTVVESESNSSISKYEVAGV